MGIKDIDLNDENLNTSQVKAFQQHIKDNTTDRATSMIIGKYIIRNFCLSDHNKCFRLNN